MTLNIGQELDFKHPADRARWGHAVKVENIQVTFSRPYGYPATLVDLVSANGTRLQWPIGWVTKKLRRVQ